MSGEHTCILSWYDNLTTSKDYINLNLIQGTDGANPDGSGFLLLDIDDTASEYLSDNGFMVKEITLTVQIEGSSRQDVVDKKRHIQRFLTTTKNYFAKFKKNIPARSDGGWHDGNAARLIFKAGGMDNQVFVDIWEGDVKRQSSPINPDSNSMTVSISLVVNALARGNRVKLFNYIPLGDFEPPFSTVSYYRAGWVFTGSYSLVVSTGAKFGTSFITLTNGATATSPTFTPGASGNVLVPSAWVQVYAGSGTMDFQEWNGATWTTLNTVTFDALGWNQYTLPAVTSSGNSYRLVFTVSVGAGNMSLDGVAVWRNPINNTAPVQEYATSGGNAGLPYFRVWGIQGDEPAPYKLYIANNSGTGNRYFVIGATKHNPAIESPLTALTFKTLSSTTSATMFFGNLGQSSSGAAALSNYTTTNDSGTVGAVISADYRARLYRAFLVYSANDSAGITAVTLQLATSFPTPATSSKTWNVALPNTYSGATNPPAASSYRIAELGDFTFQLPGVGNLEHLTDSSLPGATISVAHSASAARIMAVAGLILIPADQYAFVDTGSAVAYSMPIISTEPRNPTVSWQDSRSPIDNSSVYGNSRPIPLTLFNSGGMAMPGLDKIEPSRQGAVGKYDTVSDSTRFEYLVLVARNASYKFIWTYDVSMAVYCGLEYSPRYRDLGI